MAAKMEHEIGEAEKPPEFLNEKDNAIDKRSCDDPVLEPLCFPEHNSKAKFSIPLFCLLCDKMFRSDGINKSDALLHHLLVDHQFVIADVDHIADFKSYIHYWKRRLRESPVTDVCSVININSREEDIGPKLQYNLLCDGLPEDKQLREQLQIHRLQDILQHQQGERTDVHFSRNCLFCNLHFEGNRTVLFQHMVDNHAFNVGLPDNLVYVDELLDKLEEKLNNLQCLYCDKTFKDRTTLKDHMRKKQHKKINPKNKEFDKYYLINYLEVGKNWHDILDEDDSEINQRAKDESWDDWQEESIAIHCLFCDVTSPVTQDILMHMKECHCFDLLKITKSEGLNFYEEVKIVNYIRRQVYNCRCIFCKEKFDSNEILLRHQNEKCHFQIPNDRRNSWDQPQYFFPTFENDGLLCGLPDDDDEEDDYYGDDGGVNCEIHGAEKKLQYGDVGNNAKVIDNREDGGDNAACTRDNEGSGDGCSNDGEVCDDGNDRHGDNGCGNDCGNIEDIKRSGNDERDGKSELKQENDNTHMLAANSDGEVCVDFVEGRQDTDETVGTTDEDKEAVDIAGNRSNDQVCDGINNAICSSDNDPDGVGECLDKK